MPAVREHDHFQNAILTIVTPLVFSQATRELPTLDIQKSWYVIGLGAHAGGNSFLLARFSLDQACSAICGILETSHTHLRRRHMLPWLPFTQTSDLFLSHCPRFPIRCGHLESPFRAPIASIASWRHWPMQMKNAWCVLVDGQRCWMLIVGVVCPTVMKTHDTVLTDVTLRCELNYLSVVHPKIFRSWEIHSEHPRCRCGSSPPCL